MFDLNETLTFKQLIQKTKISLGVEELQFSGPKLWIDESVDTSLAPLANVFAERSTITSISEDPIPGDPIPKDPISEDPISKDPIQTSRSRSVQVSTIGIDNQNSKPDSKDIVVKMSCCGLSYEYRSPESVNMLCCIFCCCTCSQ